MGNKLTLAAILALCLCSGTARAIEYYELEVYGYQTAAARELEIENTSTFSSDSLERVSNQIMRSTFEFNYGLSDRWEATAYLDYTEPLGGGTEFTAFRAHARTRFAEQGELPVDLGAYFEVELPRNYRQKEMGFEFRPILERDFSRWAIKLNPQIELSHARGVQAASGGVVDPDGDVTVSASDAKFTDIGWRIEWGAATSLVYNMNEYFRPHLDWHMGFTDGSGLLLPAADIRLAHGLNLTAGMGWGLNKKTEQKIVLGRLEYEIYF